jgi:hypothetical protein
MASAQFALGRALAPNGGAEQRENRGPSPILAKPGSVPNFAFGNWGSVPVFTRRKLPGQKWGPSPVLGKWGLPPVLRFWQAEIENPSRLSSSLLMNTSGVAKKQRRPKYGLRLI